MKTTVNKVINIKSEVLFRQAEDDFYYFNKITSAVKKLENAVKLTPEHLKSIMLLGHICFVKGQVNKALGLYKKADNLKVSDSKIIASLANCYYAMKKFDDAVLYCNKALKMCKITDEFYSQVIEIKINSLVNLKRYKEAYNLYTKMQKMSDFTISKADYETINEKMQLQEKLHYSGLKIV